MRTMTITFSNGDVKTIKGIVEANEPNIMNALTQGGSCIIVTPEDKFLMNFRHIMHIHFN